MAIYHAHFGIIRRSNGQSAVASSAYRSGERLCDERNDKIHDYRRKKGVIYHEIMLCEHAPKEWNDAQTLWNKVEAAERSEKAQLAREADFALPKELDEKQQIDLAREYVKRNFVDQGMCIQLDIHNPHGNQPHFHVMMTMRAINKDGKFLPKSRTEFVLDDQGNRIPIIDSRTGKQKINNKKRGERQWRRTTVSTTNWNDQETLLAWRHDWAVSVNRALQNANVRDTDGNYVTISEKSLEEQGIHRIPTIHEGVRVRAMEKRGIQTERGGINRDIQNDNAALERQRELEIEYHECQKQNEDLLAREQQLQARLDDVKRALAATRKAIELREQEQKIEDLWSQWYKNKEAEIEEKSRLFEDEEASALEILMSESDEAEQAQPIEVASTAAPPKKSWEDALHFGNGVERLQMLRDVAHAGEQTASESPLKPESHSGYYKRIEAEYRKEHPAAVAEKRIQQLLPTKNEPKPENNRCIDHVITPDKARPENYNETCQKVIGANEAYEQRDVRQPQADIPQLSTKGPERLQRPEPSVDKQPQDVAQAAPEIPAELAKSPKRSAPEKKKRHLITKRRDGRGNGMGR